MLWVGERRGVGVGGFCHGDWLKGVEMGVGRIQWCGAVPREELPHWGRAEKVAATLSPLLGSQQPLQQVGLSDHREGSFPPSTYSFQPQGLPGSGEAP